jgi:hypothetical protein
MHPFGMFICLLYFPAFAHAATDSLLAVDFPCIRLMGKTNPITRSLLLTGWM